MSSEEEARKAIDALLEKAGWKIADADKVNLSAQRNVAIREFPLKPGHGFADYLLYVDGKAAGVIEAKKEGVTLTGVETQSDKYTKGLPDGLPALEQPAAIFLPIHRRRNPLHQRPRSHAAFAPGVRLPPARSCWPSGWIARPRAYRGPMASAAVRRARPTFLATLQTMPPLKEEGLWPAQITAIHNLEKSLEENRPRALIQMATGSGKTFTAITFIYRLIKFAGARRVLFLVDRGNLGDQTLKEFQQYVSPYNNFKFTEEYIVQRLQRQHLDTTARVCICTIQRMYSMLKGRELAGRPGRRIRAINWAGSFKEPEPIEYNPSIPIETFDIIVTDECHRSIYNLWAQVLEYFDAYLIGLTATPSKQTFGFFHQNLVMEYNHEKAVADGVNVNYDVYRIRTADHRGRLQGRGRLLRREAGTRHPQDPLGSNSTTTSPTTPTSSTATWSPRTRSAPSCAPSATSCSPKSSPAAPSAQDPHLRQGRRPRREHRRNRARGIRQGQRLRPEDHLPHHRRRRPRNSSRQFRNSYHPRIAVTVDMIATGTDIKPVEIVIFMRAVKSPRASSSR